jgi:hypothetical protein
MGVSGVGGLGNQGGREESRSDFVSVKPVMNLGLR